MSTSELLEKYLDFCASPLRGPEQIAVEFQRLLENPNVTHVSFHKPHILMVGTTPIVITAENEDFTIGEFILFLVRRREGRVWETDFRFANVTDTLTERDKNGELYPLYLHPHIIMGDYLDIAFPTGELCISHGQFEIYQALRKGHIDRVVALLLIVLKTYGTGQPFLPVDCWTSFSDEGDEDD